MIAAFIITIMVFLLGEIAISNRVARRTTNAQKFLQGHWFLEMQKRKEFFERDPELYEDIFPGVGSRSPVSVEMDRQIRCGIFELELIELVHEDQLESKGKISRI